MARLIIIHSCHFLPQAALGVRLVVTNHHILVLPLAVALMMPVDATVLPCVAVALAVEAGVVLGGNDRLQEVGVRGAAQGRSAIGKLEVLDYVVLVVRLVLLLYYGEIVVIFLILPGLRIFIDIFHHILGGFIMLHLIFFMIGLIRWLILSAKVDLLNNFLELLRVRLQLHKVFGHSSLLSHGFIPYRFDRAIILFDILIAQVALLTFLFRSSLADFLHPLCQLHALIILDPVSLLETFLKLWVVFQTIFRQFRCFGDFISCHMLLKELSLLFLPFAHQMELQVLLFSQIHVFNLLMALLKLGKVAAFLRHGPLVTRLREIDSINVIRRLAPIADNFDGQIFLGVGHFLDAQCPVLLALIRCGAMELLSDPL